ncbi:MAG: hypothetical protein KGJ55_10490 [Gammaproteobacteria bacterium]|nr:hypothetical protein [Gammaproteobacteria bacterium]
MNKLKIGILAVSAALMVGGTSVAMAADATAATSLPESGTATVYVAQRHVVYGGFGDSAYPVRIVSDGRVAGTVVPGTYLVLHLTPGQHVLSTVGSFTNVEHQTLKVAPGKSYFFDVTMGFGWMNPHVNLQQISPDAGKEIVALSTRTQEVRPGDAALAANR